MDAADDVDSKGPSRLGRKRGPVYEHFTLASERGNIKRFKCKHCEKETSQNRKRMEHHLEECPVLQPAPSREPSPLVSSGETTLQPGRKRGAIYEHFVLSAETLKGKRFKCIHCHKETSQNRSRMEHHIAVECAAVDAAAKAAVHRALESSEDVVTSAYSDKIVLALITDNVPWTLLENPFYVAAFGALQPPGTAPLTMAAARSIVLPRLQGALHDAMRRFVENAQCLTLVLDTRADEYTNVVLINEDATAYLLERMAPSMDGATILATVQSYLSSRQATVNVCSNESSAHAIYVTLTGICMGHVSLRHLAALLRHVPAVAAACNAAVRVTSVVASRPELLHAWPHPGQMAIGARSWLEHAVVLKQAIRLQAELGETLLQADDGPLLRLGDTLLAPHVVLSALSAMPGVSSGMVAATWAWSLGAVVHAVGLADDVKAAYTSAIENELVTFGEQHWMAAMVLDPRVHGAGLSPKGRRAAEAAIVELASSRYPTLEPAKLLAGLHAYTTKTGDFGAALHWEAFYVRSPRVFWGRFSDYAELCAVASLVCSYTPLAASIETYMRRAQATSPCIETDASVASLRFAHACPADATAVADAYAVATDVANALPSHNVFRPITELETARNDERWSQDGRPLLEALASVASNSKSTRPGTTPGRFSVDCLDTSVAGCASVQAAMTAYLDLVQTSR
ncbi:hypothetical protein SPRG_12557 [Saprolegnia parasitica CBS 223.65]|uniref:BED-type domain-containing protein n=1 Tax=Saprolegnia parasitica (strain CBS 223.65) TaxID=695850 RepID=A0A067C6Z8_SAPPC|nr:hypothetical protein SPRG_12557 [Saprolegnia parasitica CBS 223.65]KDO22577.1 hypothetical protein SPRG_12557 [Saprolegnia parasitica CBS 223.65]|eukprot:XP_012206693.1 hypothetical protein SPRG_12557 [Saprolegnia parasitica CBS 223.65]